MWLSTRFTFRKGDPGWAEYLAFIGLPQLEEVRTLDTMLNECVDDRGPYGVNTFSELGETLRALPRAVGDRQYYLLYLDAEQEQAPQESPDCRLLGYDLSDETHTSSVLNCGPWTGELAPLTQRLNRFGLLSYGDARLAKELLPRAWPDEPHARVTIWALYEIADTNGQRFAVTSVATLAG